MHKFKIEPIIAMTKRSEGRGYIHRAGVLYKVTGYECDSKDKSFTTSENLEEFLNFLNKNITEFIYNSEDTIGYPLILFSFESRPDPFVCGQASLGFFRGVSNVSPFTEWDSANGLRSSLYETLIHYFTSNKMKVPDELSYLSCIKLEPDNSSLDKTLIELFNAVFSKLRSQRFGLVSMTFNSRFAWVKEFLKKKFDLEESVISYYNPNSGNNLQVYNFNLSKV